MANLLPLQQKSLLFFDNEMERDSPGWFWPGDHRGQIRYTLLGKGFI